MNKTGFSQIEVSLEFTCLPHVSKLCWFSCITKIKYNIIRIKHCSKKSNYSFIYIQWIQKSVQIHLLFIKQNSDVKLYIFKLSTISNMVYESVSVVKCHLLPIVKIQPLQKHESGFFLKHKQQNQWLINHDYYLNISINTLQHNHIYLWIVIRILTEQSQTYIAWYRSITVSAYRANVKQMSIKPVKVETVSNCNHIITPRN